MIELLALVCRLLSTRAFMSLVDGEPHRSMRAATPRAPAGILSGDSELEPFHSPRCPPYECARAWCDGDAALRFPCDMSDDVSCAALCLLRLLMVLLFAPPPA